MDGRRGSTGPGNAARGPSSGFQSPSSGGPGPASMDWIIGTRVKITNILDETVEGSIFSYDTLANCVSLITSPTNTYPPPKDAPVDVRIIKIPFIKDVAVVAPSKPTSPTAAGPGGGAGGAGVKGPYAAAEPQIRPLSIAMIRNREQAALRSEYDRSQGHGVGVSEEGQDIYNALSKTMPCRWQGKQIVVLDTIIIQEPYTPEKCTAPNNNANALTRVKKVLEGERKRLDTIRRSNSNTPNPQADRKGG